MDKSDLLTIGEVAHRSGFPPSALRFYEREGLLRTTRTSVQETVTSLRGGDKQPEIAAPTQR